MLTRKQIATAACAASLIIPGALMAQTDTTTRRDTTGRVTSQQRVRVQKGGSAGGTLELTAAERARQDSIAAAEAARMAAERARADSIAMVEKMRADSVAAVERARADSIAAVERRRADSLAVIERARQDSIAAEEARRAYLARYRFGGNGWYVGLGGGASAPTGDFNAIGYRSGVNVNVPIGWHRPGNFLGVRMNLGYNQFSGRTFAGIDNPAPNAVQFSRSNPQVYSASLDLTAALPFTPVRNVSLYGVGGAGLYHFRSLGTNTTLGGYLGNDILEQGEVGNVQRNVSKIGASVGGGLDWTVGTSSVFVESRFVSVFADKDDVVALRDYIGANRANRLHWVPITVGVKIR